MMFELFISYADLDQAWIEGFLIPALGLPRAQIITKSSFIPGRPMLSEFERAIQNSHYVLIVFSPAYLADNWAILGEQLSSFASVTSQADRLIPLVLRPCELPLRVEFRVRLDCTVDENWLAELARLREILERPVPQAEVIPCPYPGLLPFAANDAGHFFGREDEVAELVTRLRYHHFLMIIGPSGSGKSSLVSAGLLPALQKSQSEYWNVRTLRPGSAPLAALTEATRDLPDEEILQPPAPARLLLVVDQFEELFVLPSKEERDQAIARIQKLRQNRTCAMVLIMRADFYGDLINSALWEIDAGQRFEVAPLRAPALRKAMQLPAASVGVFLESGLVEQLVGDVGNEPGALPLLQETLSLLWKQRVQRLIPWSAYQKLGVGECHGLSRAIACMADAVYAGLTPVQQAITRRIFLRLIHFGEGRADTRRQQPVSALSSAEEDSQVCQWVIRHLAESRLLTLNGEIGSCETRVDLSHEALITSWPRLQEWIADYKKAELTRRRLQARTEEWLQTGQRGGLLDAVHLKHAQEWLDAPEARVLGVDEQLRKLIKASQAAQSSNRRNRWMIPTFTVLGVLLLAVVGWLGYVAVQRERANRLNPIVHIPGGRATIGDAGQPSPDLTFQVSLSGFDLEKYEVSNGQFCLCAQSLECVRSLPYTNFSVCDSKIATLPVTNVTLEQADQFCKWLGGRLPTDMEWEWAARGAENRLFPTGNKEPVPGEINFQNFFGSPLPVDQIMKDSTSTDPSNTLVGMAGNVREWTVSWYVKSYKLVGYQTTYWPTPLPGANYISTRGGGYRTSKASFIRSSYRSSSMAGEQSSDLGFRCLLNLSTEQLRKEVLSNP